VKLSDDPRRGQSRVSGAAASSVKGRGAGRPSPEKEGVATAAGDARRTTTAEPPSAAKARQKEAWVNVGGET